MMSGSIESAAAPAKPRTEKKAKSNSKISGKKQTKTTEKSRSQSAVKRERKQNEKEIKQTRAAINDNSRRTRENLDRLNNLDAQITRQENAITTLNSRLDSINNGIATSENDIRQIERDVARLRAEVRKSLRDMRAARRRISSVAFVFSASDFNSARKRYAYLKKLQDARDRKIRQLRDRLALLDKHRAELLTLQNYHSATLNKLSVAKQVMQTQQGEALELGRQLTAEGRNLQIILAEKRQRAAQLDAELNRIIEAEARAAAEARKKKKPAQNPDKRQNGTNGKPQKHHNSQISGNADAERTLSGPFAHNKGRLLFPVAGQYTITGTFGRSTHHGLAIDNSGIDIATAPGTKARAIFDGQVASVFMIPTYHTVVIIRHGGYLTVYAGLSSINVAKGQKVHTGQNIGTIWTNPEMGRTELHFEVRHERTKLNPLQWVR